MVRRYRQLSSMIIKNLVKNYIIYIKISEIYNNNTKKYIIIILRERNIYIYMYVYVYFIAKIYFLNVLYLFKIYLLPLSLHFHLYIHTYTQTRNMFSTYVLHRLQDLCKSFTDLLCYQYIRRRHLQI